MTDRLTPGQVAQVLREVAAHYRQIRVKNVGWINERAALIRRAEELEIEEAARREAEAKPYVAQASGSCTYPRCGCSSRAECSVKDKPAPAAPAFWKGSTLDPECKSAPAADSIKALTARVRELEAVAAEWERIAGEHSARWEAEKARADQLAAALREARPLVEKWCRYQGNSKELFSTYLDPIDTALASEGGKPNG